MATYSSSNIVSLCFLFYLLIPIHASSISPSTSALPETICTSTPHPHFCREILPSSGVFTVQDYARQSLQHSMSITATFLSMINHFLKAAFALSEIALRALEDCEVLASLNRDFLSKIDETIRFAETIQSSEAEDLHTYLSAIITNHETCLDGLRAINDLDLGLRNVLFSVLSNDTMSYSVSLALFLDGWGHHRERKLAVSSWGRRMLLQAYNNNVKVRQMVVVNPNGSGNFITINDAIASAPNNTAASDGYFLIHIVGGVYQEYVTIGHNKRYIMMVGDGIYQTIITGDRNMVDGWTTFTTPTFVVTGEGFVGVNITFRNTAGAAKHQAVAVRNGADLSTFYSCSFEGYQDTLYAHSLRQFYRNCDIYGTIDFIFGNAAVVLQNCNIYPRLPLPNQFNAITAQGRIDINQNTGISLHTCTIKPAPDLASSNGMTRTYLGRPWKEYSRTVYMQSFLDYLIDPAGWIAWNGEFALNTLYYAEYNNIGPASVTTNRVNWPGYHVIGATEAANFTVSNFIQGDYWLPTTSVPYAGGLV